MTPRTHGENFTASKEQTTIVRPRLVDFYEIPVSQEHVDFAIPFLDSDIPLYVDPFLLWKSPSLQDNSLHTALVSSFNHLGYLSRKGKEKESKETLIQLTECVEVGLGNSRNKVGHRISEKTADKMLSIFNRLPNVAAGGFEHIEEIQFFVDQISKDRISDITCSILKSFLIDYTVNQCEAYSIPMGKPQEITLFDYKRKRVVVENVKLPENPFDRRQILFVPKHWLRFIPWINYDDYFNSIVRSSENMQRSRQQVLNFNRSNYGMVKKFIDQKEKSRSNCKNDPLFSAIPIVSAKRHLNAIKKLRPGKEQNADKEYEKHVGPLLTSLLYPDLDFAAVQSRTDSGVLIRDLVFYNSRSNPFLKEIFDDYETKQVVMELKNVESVNRENLNQLNRYLGPNFGRFGVIVTRRPFERKILKNTIDLWSGQRKALLSLTDEDLELMVTVYESHQRKPIEVLHRNFIEFIRRCPS